jgi:cellulose synthase/poly-beta-1,6-N-acetylglucosamine synthase-like glycosyltransferase
LTHLLNTLNYALFLYYLACNLIYLVALIVAIRASVAHQRQLESHRLHWINDSPMAPPITLIAPAHNEELSIRAAIRSLMNLDYPELEIIVVNDGSIDRTLDALKDEFELYPVRVVCIKEVPSAEIKATYKSKQDPRLWVIDKEAAGSKADAVNAGLNSATSPYVCIVDADSILERDALLRIMIPVMADPKRVVGVGGIIRVLNGSVIEKGRLEQVRLPRKGIEMIQVVEYLRAFLIGREAWAQGNMMMIISGAFGLFRTDLVRAVGGYRAHAIGEDFDLVTRLHRYLLEKGAVYRIDFLPDPVCWTEAPSDLKSLGRQRARWQKGLLDTLLSNRDMLFRRRYGRIGFLALPYLWIFELFAPVIEIGGIGTILLAAAIGDLSHHFFLQFMIFGYAFATVISIGSVLQEEITYKRYNRWQDVVLLVSVCFFEHFPYRQLHMIWRLQGLVQFLRGDMTWKPLNRQGLDSAKVT